MVPNIISDNVLIITNTLIAVMSITSTWHRSVNEKLQVSLGLISAYAFIEGYIYAYDSGYFEEPINSHLAVLHKLLINERDNPVLEEYLLTGFASVTITGCANYAFNNIVSYIGHSNMFDIVAAAA